MNRYTTKILLLLVFFSSNLQAQTVLDSAQRNRVYTNLTDALKAPEMVYRMDLSNQTVPFADSVWAMFINLEYLSLKNDHLKKIPDGVGNLSNLKVLDLSGNDFKVLPLTFNRLTSLEELFLNNDRFFQLDESIPILGSLPNLRSLHFENDRLKSLPKNMNQLSQLEALYLNNNRFKEVPESLVELKNLQYLDFQNNRLDQTNPEIHNQGFGFKIQF